VTLTGKTVSHYEILSKIGAGGMASVYLANDLKHGRQVAIKVMNSDIGASIGTTRFLREIEIAARLTHPHILPLFDSGVVDDQPFYVMPYIEGESLRQRIIRQKWLAIDDALRFATEIASALEYAHDYGLIHRDIKPENVLLSNGIALVADFGIARFTNADEQAPITMANTAIGTPAYMSPEQLEPLTAIDSRTDLYSLGCVLYEMLVGKPPFTGPLHSLAHQHLSVEPNSVSESRSEVPSYVEEAIRKLLQKNPEDRYATAADFVRAVKNASTDAATISFEKPKRYVGNNLPKDRTRFIGRDQELKAFQQILQSSRLLTLAGLGGCGKPHSLRRASSGSILLARSAGIKHATHAEINNNINTAANARTSTAGTPNRVSCIARRTRNAPTSPITPPMTAKAVPSFKTKPMTLERCAPSAMRTPNSCVRCATPNDITP